MGWLWGVCWETGYGFTHRVLGETGLAELNYLCYITLKSSERPCIKDHHPGVGGEDIAPNIRAEKAEACSGSFHSQCPHWNGISNITLKFLLSINYMNYCNY